jgi:hypothetical protein
MWFDYQSLQRYELGLSSQCQKPLVIFKGHAGSQASPFIIRFDTTDTNRVSIYLLTPLDYEKKSEYINYLQLRAKVKKKFL